MAEQGPFSVTVVDGGRPGQQVIVAKGPLTMTNVGTFKEAVQSDKSPVTIIDLTGVQYADSSGLGALMNVYVTRRQVGKKVALVGCAGPVRNVLKVTNVAQFFKFYDTVAAAEEAMGTTASAANS